jgi:cobalt-zinc-cadmium efflux system outer membrane protein
MSHMRAGFTAATIAICSTAVTPHPSAALDLETALRQVAAANPTLAAREAMTEAARRRVGPAGAWPSPMVELGVVNVPTTGRFDEDPMTMKMIGLSQRVPLFGGNRLARGAARAEVSSESAAADLTAFEIWGMTWRAYADAYYTGELGRLAAAHGTVMEHMVLSARARYESGNGRLEDILRAQAEQARTLADLASFRGEERGARARLDALRGVMAGASADSLAAPPDVAIPSTPDVWLATVVPSHPRLREQQAKVDTYRLSARAARRMTWPDLELRGSYGWRQTLAGSAHGGPLEQDNMFSATAGFMLPIFAGSRERSEAAGMDAMARASEAERTAAELDLRAQVAAIHATATAARRMVGLLADTVVTTLRRAADASWVSYRAGTSDLWRVFESTHALYSEEIALLRARQELARAGAQILALTGRGDLLGIALPTIRRER